MHNHGPVSQESAQDEWDWFWKLITVIGGIYGFYLFETIMHFLIERKQNEHIQVRDHDDQNNNYYFLYYLFSLTWSEEKKVPIEKMKNNNS